MSAGAVPDAAFTTFSDITERRQAEDALRESERRYRTIVETEPECVKVLDADGQKMSKSRGNVVSPWDMIQEFGADTVRLYLLASSQVWLPKRFDQNAIPSQKGGKH